jgi:N-hydroxyarylamine O-acetyltransferase
VDEGDDVRDGQAHPRHVLIRVPDFDLAAYAARIGAPVPDTIDLAALQRMHVAHVGAIAFENLDPQWRRTVRIDPASVWAKLVGSARGGYCFEQNTLFREVLRARGVAVTAREARVRSGATTRRARTHMTLVATIAGVDHLCDVGFGAYTPLQPVPMNGEPSRQHAWVYRIVPEGSLAVLQWQRDGGWQDLYAIEPGEPGDIDFEMANWYTCTWPESGFVQTMTAQRATPDARYTLRNYTLTEDARDTSFVRTLRREEIAPVLRGVFGLDVPDGARFRALDG